MLVAKDRRLATSWRFFAVKHPAIPLTVACSAIFVTIGREQQGKSDGDFDGEGRQVPAWAG
jgi:hypothetical protein